MAESLEQLNFASPEMTWAFSKTPEQKEERDKLVADLVEHGVDQPDERANQLLFEKFASDASATTLNRAMKELAKTPWIVNDSMLGVIGFVATVFVAEELRGLHRDDRRAFRAAHMPKERIGFSDREASFAALSHAIPGGLVF